MYTVLWRENDNDRWDKLESKEKLISLLNSLKENPDVCESDIWIFLPEADKYTRNYAELMKNSTCL